MNFFTKLNFKIKCIEFCLAYIAASESCAFPLGSELLCEVDPGEMIEISQFGVKSVWQVNKIKNYLIYAVMNKNFEIFENL